MTVEEREEARRRLALDLLRELRVVERLSELGPVEITGAMRHHLVVDRDIDVDVTVDELDAHGCFAAIGEIASDPRVLRVVYRNEAETSGWLAFDLVCRDAEGERWTIGAILAPKEALVGDADYRSMDAYRAVVDDGIRDLDGFLRWRDVNGSEELAHWLPGSVPPA